MKSIQYIYTKNGWNKALDSSFDSLNTLVIIFASPDIKAITLPLKELCYAFPQAKIIGCSTSGEIYQDRISHHRFVVQVIKFEKTEIKTAYQEVTKLNSDTDAGKILAAQLFNSELKAIFVLSDGIKVNGSKLTNGIASTLPNEIIVTGGLAGDDDRFEKTWVIANGEIKTNHIVAVGFYGDSLYYGYGSQGGWDKFGYNRKVTSSKDNILYTLDSQPALHLYKHYLGNRAEGLPKTGLLFPLCINHDGESKVRTILSVNEEEQSITFAGDIPQGSMVTLMKANFNRLIEGAARAAKAIKYREPDITLLVAIAISCVGRRVVLGQRTEEELEETLNNLPPKTQQIGYYSYGEISPLNSGKCDLHNQTMTLTLIGEY